MTLLKYFKTKSGVDKQFTARSTSDARADGPQQVYGSRKKIGDDMVSLWRLPQPWYHRSKMDWIFGQSKSRHQQTSTDL